MKQLGNVRAIFKIDRNLDYHLRLEDETALEAKVLQNKHLAFKICRYTTINTCTFQQRWNFVILTKHFPEEKHSRRFVDSLRGHDFIKDFSVFPIKSKPLKRQLGQAALSFLGLLGTYIPSYQVSLAK